MMKLVSNQNSYLREVRESQKVFSALVNAMEKSHKAVIAAIEERQRDEEKRVETLVTELQQEIQELRKGATEIDPQDPVNGDQNDDTMPVYEVGPLPCFQNGESRQHLKKCACLQNWASLSCLSEMKDWSQVSVETDPCIGVTRRALSDIMEKIRAEVNRLSKSGKCTKFIHLLQDFLESD